MSELGQFSGMACYYDEAEWNRCMVAEFGELVVLRVEPTHYEIYVSGKWYPCELLDLVMGMGVEEFIESVKRLVGKQQEITA